MRDVESVAPGLLLDDQQETRPVVDDGVTDGWGVARLDSRHVPQRDGDGAAVPHGNPLEILRPGDRRAMGDRQPLVRGVHESPGTHGDGLGSGSLHVGQRHAVGPEAVRVDQDLQLSVPLAPDRHVRDPGHGHEPGPDGPPGQGCELDLGERLGAQTDLENPARRGQRWEDHRRARQVGQQPRHTRHPLLCELSCRHEVRPALEEENDRREPEDGLRTHGLEPGGADDGVLDGHGHQGLHVFRGEPRDLGLDLHAGRGEFREDVEGRVPQAPGPGEDEGEGKSEDDPAEAKRDANDRTHGVSSARGRTRC